VICRVPSLNFSDFLHIFFTLLAGMAEMENFIVYEFRWTDSTGNALFLLGDVLCSHSTLDIPGTKALKTLVSECS